MVKADLHIHTTVSDGKYTPTELVDLAIQRNLTTIAITDHDCFEGYEEARTQANKRGGINVIVGMEVSTSFLDNEVHMLAYLFDHKNEALIELVNKQKNARLERAKRMITKLQEMGHDISIEEVQERAGNGLIGRPHFAKLLMRKGIVANQNEAFVRFLAKDGSAYSPSEHCDIKTAIDAVHRASGVCILAHPGRHTTEEQLEQLVEFGIDGVEYIHPSHDYTLQKKYLDWAQKHEKIVTGGSDFHGFTNRDNQYFGLVCVDASIVANLRHKANQKN